jgi:hypothetical protein
MEKSKSGIICVVKKLEKGHRTPFSKSAQTTKKCLFDNSKSANSQKDAHTTIFMKYYRKNSCDISGTGWHLLPLEKTK